MCLQLLNTTKLGSTCTYMYMDSYSVYTHVKYICGSICTIVSVVRLCSCDCTELEEGTPIINWSSELVDELGGYLYPLWNRTAGDCLLDSVLQATWGVVDRDGTLRRALADSLVDGASL